LERGFYKVVADLMGSSERVSAAPMASQVRVRGGLVAAAWLALAGALAASIYLRPPGEAWYPSCAFHALTGLHCSGCGTVRALHALLHGHFAQAWAWNALTVSLLPFLAGWGVVQLWRAWSGRPAWGGRIPAWTIWTLLAIIVAFWILRNLPFHPFPLLAPHRLL